MYIESSCNYVTNLPHVHFRMAKSAINYTCGIAQRQLSDYYDELDTKIKAQYLEKISLIQYVLETAEFFRDTFHLASLG